MHPRFVGFSDLTRREAGDSKQTTLTLRAHDSVEAGSPLVLLSGAIDS